MLAIIALSCATLFFALPVGVILGIVVKKQKDAGLLKYAKPDMSLIPKVLPLVIAAALLSGRGITVGLNRISAVLPTISFVEALLIAYGTYRFLLRRSAQKR